MIKIIMQSEFLAFGCRLSPAGPAKCFKKWKAIKMIIATQVLSSRFSETHRQQIEGDQDHHAI
jgi:hypothetical protein